MRGADTFTESLVTLRKLEDFVPANHPLREIRTSVNTALQKLGPMLTAMYAVQAKCERGSRLVSGCGLLSLSTITSGNDKTGVFDVSGEVQRVWGRRQHEG